MERMLPPASLTDGVALSTTAVAESPMSTVVAIVKSIVGQVIAVSPEGIRRVLIEGDRLFAGEQVLTGVVSY